MRCCHRHAPAAAGSSDPHPFSLPGATEHYAAPRPVRAEHVRIELDLDFAQHTLAGTCTTRVSAVRTVSTVTFDAVDLDVTDARVDGRSAAFSNSGAHVRVELPRALDAGQACDIALTYRARPRRGLYFWGPTRATPTVRSRRGRRGRTSTRGAGSPAWTRPRRRPRRRSSPPSRRT
ncbi:hypothetical protein [Corallococcus sp. 4LFB]|uniref:hypothetical protein n=1 Tax=Corallococcus sp. 4LFB TaxID=3383249 RepID=UPI003976858F